MPVSEEEAASDATAESDVTDVVAVGADGVAVSCVATGGGAVVVAAATVGSVFENTKCAAMGTLEVASV